MAETKGAYQVSQPKYLLNALNYFHRNYAAPIDDTMVWNTKGELEDYIAANGSYAYAGQIVAVANGTVDATNGQKDYSLYVIRSDKSLQAISGSKEYSSVADAQNDIANIAEGTLLSIWNEEKGKTELYTVDKQSDGEKTLVRQSFDPSDLPDMYWTNLSHASNDSTTFTVDEIQDAVDTGKAVDTNLSMADDRLSYKTKALAFVEDIPTEYVAAKITGVIDISHIPQGALERCHVVANDEARFALTTAQVQNGDTVKVTNGGEDADGNAITKMYFVKDDSKLNTAEGYEEYSAGAAASVPWAGVTGKPTTLEGYGITDAVKSNEVVTAAAANKILKLNADGKLPASITGDAATLGTHPASYFAVKSEFDTLNTTVGDIETRLTTAEGKITALEGKASAHDTALETLNTTTLPNIYNGSSITALEAAKLTGKVARANLPTDVSGMGISVADTTARLALTKETNGVYNGWIVKQNDGSVYVVVDDTNLNSESGYLKIVSHGGDSISWENITGKPTTLEGYGITDAVNKSEKVTVASAANKDKILVLNKDGKLDVDITGTAANATKLNGQAASYYATQSALNGVDSRLSTAETDIVNLKSGEAITALAASKLTGTIPIERLPQGALERLVVVANDEARFALTADKIQVGDSIKVTSTGLMYIVVDDTQLTSEAGYEIYTAGRATAVDWSGVENKPTRLRGDNAYGFEDIADVVFEDECINNAVDSDGHAMASNAGKLVKLDTNGKLAVQITGKVAWAQLENAPTSTVTQIDNAVTAANHANRAQLDKIGENTGSDSVLRPTYNNQVVALLTDCKKAALDLIPLVDSEPADAVAGQFCLIPITGASAG